MVVFRRKRLASQYLLFLECCVWFFAFSVSWVLYSSACPKVDVLCCCSSLSPNHILQVLALYFPLTLWNHLLDLCLWPCNLLRASYPSVLSSVFLSWFVDVRFPPHSRFGADSDSLCHDIKNAAHCFLSPCGLLLHLFCCAVCIQGGSLLPSLHQLNLRCPYVLPHYCSEIPPYYHFIIRLLPCVCFHRPLYNLMVVSRGMVFGQFGIFCFWLVCQHQVDNQIVSITFSCPMVGGSTIISNFEFIFLNYIFPECTIPLHLVY